jgi:hypothetical protein
VIESKALESPTGIYSFQEILGTWNEEGICQNDVDGEEER